MIAQIRGQLVEKRPGVVIVETQGIGYQVFVSLSTFYDLPEATQGVRLHTYTHVREDLLQLFGFSTFLEKEIFQILIGVSGIGPKLALNILSGIAPADLIASLQSEDVARLTQIPGVGRKTAERLVFDLKEKIGKIAVRGETAKEEKGKKGQVVDDVVSALVNLGYRRNQADSVVEQVWRQRPEASLEEILKESLRALAAG
ncbi:MAG: Holliday junction branch migration protein RuvA [Deltaproteobacteria bacterium]|nr:Holliday junction branch migration protein RuvA [Deltaproteobacteria bacterium]